MIGCFSRIEPTERLVLLKKLCFAGGNFLFESMVFVQFLIESKCRYILDEKQIREPRFVGGWKMFGA